MTVQQLKQLVTDKLNINDIITLTWRDSNGTITKRIKAVVKGFYDTYILTEHDGYNECFSYFEVLKHMEG